MSQIEKQRRSRVPLAIAFAALLAGVLAIPRASAAEECKGKIEQQVVVPGEDRFEPFVVTIHPGDCVEWVNLDTDDHTVVGDPVFTTTDHRNVNHRIHGTESHHGEPGSLILHFDDPGVFVYYCRFHAHLNEAGQPVAPGPDGGIEDENGNFGTPMMGVVVISDDIPKR